MSQTILKGVALVIFVIFISNLGSLHVSAATATAKPSANNSGHGAAGHGEVEGIKVADFKWHHVQIYIIISLFILVASIMKTIYHHISFLVKYLPESNVLIVMGTIIGVIIFFTVPKASRVGSVWELTPELFFLILLPPIMLEAAYSLYDRAFLDNIGSIMYFAVIGTVFNFLIIGFSIYGISAGNIMGEPRLNLTMSHSLLFGSFIVAVDPVAVLAIFSEIGVDKGLYYMVFGESLLNDAVTVVLYNIMNSFTVQPTVTPVDVVLGVVSFFTISLGGALVGIVVGIITCLITRFTYSTKVIEPLVILICAYLAYLLGDLFGWSGLIAIITCGLVQVAYAFQNVSRKALVTVKYCIKMLASIGEALIFVYLGIELVKDSHYWHWGFALWALALCILSRYIVTFVSCFVINRQNRLRKIRFTEQFIIGFGGLRGAVAFALSTLLSEDNLLKAGIKKDMYVTTTLFIIMFTCIIMGMVIKPIVKCLHIHLEEKAPVSVFNEVIEHMSDHVTAGIEEILGRKGESYFVEWFDHLDDVWIRPILQRDPKTHDQQIVDMYEKVSLKVHEASMSSTKELYDERVAQLAPGLRNKIPSSVSFEDLAHLQDCPSEEKIAPSLSPDSSYPNLPVKERNRVKGKKEVTVSTVPKAGEVRMLMSEAKKDTMKMENLTKSKASDHDLANRVHEVRKRIAKGVHILSHYRNHQKNHEHKPNRLGSQKKQNSMLDAVNENQDEGVFTLRENRDSVVRFNIDEQDDIPKMTNDVPKVSVRKLSRVNSGTFEVNMAFDDDEENTKL